MLLCQFPLTFLWTQRRRGCGGKEGVLYHRTAFGWFFTTWNGFHGGISLVWVLLLLFPLFFEEYLIEIDPYIRHSKYHAKSQFVSLFFNCFCCCYRWYKLLFNGRLSKIKYRRASNFFKKVLLSPKLAYALKQRCLLSPRNLFSQLHADC